MNKKNFYKITYIIILVFLLLFNSCKEAEPVGPDHNDINAYKPGIKLSLDDNTCKELWLNVNVTDTMIYRNVRILRDGKEIYNFNMQVKDTTVNDDTLSPGKSYSYTAEYIKDNIKLTSEKVTVTMCDTTSHDNIEWTLYKLADHGYPYSVEIINENDIWVSGYMIDNNDSLYNLAHWNGVKWTMYYKNLYNKYTSAGESNFNDIISLNNNLFLSFQYINVWNNEIIKVLNKPYNNYDESTNSIWGLDENNFFVGSTKGTIAYYKYDNCIKLRSANNPEMRITDIYGDNQGENVWFAGYNDGNGFTTLLDYSNGSLNKIFEGRTEIGYFTSLWTDNKDKIYFGFNDRIKMMKNKNNRQVRELFNLKKDVNQITQVTSFKGYAFNDIYACTNAWGYLCHFNGSTVRYYDFGLKLHYMKIKIKGNIVAAVGSNWREDNKTGTPYVVIGRRK